MHHPIVLGIVLFAVAAKKMVEHASDPLGGAGRFALGAGVAIFLLGFALGRYRSIRRIAWERLAGAAAALVAVLALPDLAAAALMAVVIGVLVLAIALETIRLRAVRTLSEPLRREDQVVRGRDRSASSEARWEATRSNSAVRRPASRPVKSNAPAIVS